MKYIYLKPNGNLCSPVEGSLPKTPPLIELEPKATTFEIDVNTAEWETYWKDLSSAISSAPEFRKEDVSDIKSKIAKSLGVIEPTWGMVYLSPYPVPDGFQIINEMTDGWMPTYNDPDNNGCEQPEEPTGFLLLVPIQKADSAQKKTFEEAMEKSAQRAHIPVGDTMQDQMMTVIDQMGLSLVKANKYSINLHKEGDSIIRIYNPDGHVYCMYPYHLEKEANKHLSILNNAKIEVEQELKKEDGIYYTIVIQNNEFRKLLAVQTNPELKYWFKDQQVTLETLVNILEETRATKNQEEVKKEPRKLAMDELIASIEDLLLKVKSGDVVMTAHAILGKARSLRVREEENIKDAYINAKGKAKQINWIETVKIAVDKWFTQTYKP